MSLAADLARNRAAYRRLFAPAQPGEDSDLPADSLPLPDLPPAQSVYSPEPPAPPEPAPIYRLESAPANIPAANTADISPAVAAQPALSASSPDPLEALLGELAFQSRLASQSMTEE